MDSNEAEVMIRLENLTVGYGNRRLIENVDAEFVAGRLVALLGRNGTGKSSLLRVIAGIDRQIDGDVEIDGVEVHAMKPQKKARTVSFVTTQRVRIPNLRCCDVVGLGRAPYSDWVGNLTDADKEIVERSLALVGLERYADRTMDKMSDGECQRVMIARAFAQDTPVMLLDEPTSFLDLPNRYELCLLLLELAKSQNKCVLFSTHELDIALSLCDDIALIDTPYLHVLPTGQMIKSGHIERLFTAKGITFDATDGYVKINKVN